MTSLNNTTDTLHRPLRDLRISVTDRCNFRCRYCMPEEVFGPDYAFLPQEQLLSFQEMTRLVCIFTSLGVQKIRLTGGEPLLRKGLATFIRMLNAIEGVHDIALTTNGSLLEKYARELKDAGLQRVNVSLDSLDDPIFHRMNGGHCDVATVLKGIEAAAKVGMKVKVNMVLQNGVNDEGILPMACFFRGSSHTLRFIEFMDVGNSNGWNLKQVVSKQEIVARIHAEMPLEPIQPDHLGEVASRYRYKGTEEEIGIISSVTESFCSTCTRARLSANGHLYTCLFGTQGTDLRSHILSGANDEELRKLILELWSNRGDRYSDERLKHTQVPKGKKIEMSYIGG